MKNKRFLSVIFTLICISQQFLFSQDFEIVGDAFSINTVSACAANIDKCFTLTSPTNNQIGAVWEKTPIDLTKDFDATFCLMLGTAQHGADGFAFVMRGLGSSNIGSPGQGLAYSGITPSVAVEFDTWNNGATADDIVPNHTGMYIDSDWANPLVPSISLKPVNPKNTSDGNYHSSRIVWDATNKNFKMYFDGVERINVDVDLTTDVFNGENLVYWGFTSSTGGKHNLHQICFPRTSLNLEDIIVCDKNYKDTTFISYYNSGFTSYTWTNILGDTIIDWNDIKSPNPFDLKDTVFAVHTGDSYFGSYILNIVYNNILYTDTLNVIINNPSNSIDSIVSCSPITWIDGEIYSSNNNTATDTIFGGSSIGCDSIITLNLIINNPSNSIDSIVSCGPIEWIDGKNYSSSNNTATDTIFGGSSTGCDSIITLNLIMNNPSNSIDSIVSCSPITWIDGKTYSSSNNTATDTIFGGGDTGCDSIITLNLTMKGFRISLGEDVSFCDENVLLTPGYGYASYLWNDGSNNDSLEVNKEGIYSVTVTDTNGCSAFNDVNVITDCPFTLFVPNTFTPNGDNNNSVFSVISTNVESLEVFIFNRWGEAIYSWKNLKGFWDGNNDSGVKVPDGVYPYVIKYSYYDKKTLIKDKKIGHVTLVR